MTLIMMFRNLEIVFFPNRPLGLLLQLSFMKILYDQEDKFFFPRRALNDNEFFSKSWSLVLGHMIMGSKLEFLSSPQFWGYSTLIFLSLGGMGVVWVRDRGDECFFLLLVYWLVLGFEYLKINDGKVKIADLTLIHSNMRKILLFFPF